MLMSTGMATTGVADIGNDITEPDTTFAKLPHCLMSDSNPAPEYYIFYITGDAATGIGIERFTA